MTAAKLPGRNWLRMVPADFDRDAPAAPDAADRPVPAVPDECGTVPLFGEESAAARTPDAHMPAGTFPEQADTLF
ncbi:hypothetical protein [Streptomyces stelliscabiei]|uniref:hypothetical protein n=1 Tax=Streptomyces stelliscabiei TaxID=146820 RepID=UPI0029BC133C|nr:hypothetical protein [Streptomyces stelliscabiei]MDX2554721.1 hypothetical protein [Streptomyces stelliscabiei]MDX2613248.1 hypothetical protein [Streptomyces stelliscabiei]MDX2638476.1 hypothetical protein [Streptomyces stelliscabiei]MDX2661628.1 hypothetical protein [Streptomyces stelliscabiei]MDX2712239.1 hypothetical protein [Streptomyces stelliscabiei]